MITTLDESIQHCEEVANKQFSEGCSECANEHLILAGWLRELKAFRIVSTLFRLKAETVFADNNKLYKEEFNSLISSKKSE